MVWCLYVDADLRPSGLKGLTVTLRAAAATRNSEIETWVVSFCHNKPYTSRTHKQQYLYTSQKYLHVITADDTHPKAFCNCYNTLQEKKILQNENGCSTDFKRQNNNMLNNNKKHTNMHKRQRTTDGPLQTLRHLILMMVHSDDDNLHRSSKTHGLETLEAATELLSWRWLSTTAVGASEWASD